MSGRRELEARRERPPADVCNYGVGSAGFGAFRELAAHVKTSNWVLSCASAA